MLDYGGKRTVQGYMNSTCERAKRADASDSNGVEVFLTTRVFSFVYLSTPVKSSL